MANNTSDDELRDFLRKRITNISTAAEDDIVQLIRQREEQVTREAKLLILDELIDIESKTFSQWTQKDIANFFDVVGRKYRTLEQHTTTHKGDQ